MAELSVALTAAKKAASTAAKRVLMTVASTAFAPWFQQDILRFYIRRRETVGRTVWPRQPDSSVPDKVQYSLMTIHLQDSHANINIPDNNGHRASDNHFSGPKK